MKSILLSIKPKWVAKILNGEKTIEVRKKFPKDYKGWVYIYCTKGKELLMSYKNSWGKRTYDAKPNDKHAFPSRNNNKVVARFYCDKVEELYWYGDENFNESESRYCDSFCKTDSLKFEEILKKTNLSHIELKNCCMTNYDTLQTGYAIHISQLEIFDKPKELSEFYNKPHITFTRNGMLYGCTPLTKAPQSYCYCEVVE